MARRWTSCWKCEKDIMSRDECNYVKCRQGNYDLCNECYGKFLEKNSDLILTEKVKRLELSRSLAIAISDFHDKMVESESPLSNGSLIHKGDYWKECDICISMCDLIKKKEDKD